MDMEYEDKCMNVLLCEFNAFTVLFAKVTTVHYLGTCITKFKA